MQFMDYLKHISHCVSSQKLKQWQLLKRVPHMEISIMKAFWNTNMKASSNTSTGVADVLHHVI